MTQDGRRMFRVKGWVSALVRTLVPLVLLAAAGWGAWWLIASAPVVEKVELPEVPTPVEVIHPVPHADRIEVRAFGNVKPVRRATLQAEVGGRVLEMHEDLVLGGLVEQGDLLVRIDPRDHELALEQAEAEVARLESELAIEQGRRRVAEHEWELLGESIGSDEFSRELALREPQMAEIRARIAAATARVEAARVELERTAIRAPFAALITEESVEVGELLSPRSPVATLAGVDAFHVEVSLPISELEMIAQRLAEGERPTARVRQGLGAGRTVELEGRVERLLGALVPESRMARALVRVDDPLRLRGENDRGTPLLLGAYVEVLIEGPKLERVVELPRVALREGDVVWTVTSDDRLAMREVRVVDRRPHVVLIAGGLEAGEPVIVSAIPVAVAGMAVETVAAHEGAAPDADAEPGAARSRGADSSPESATGASEAESEEAAPSGSESGR